MQTTCCAVEKVPRAAQDPVFATRHGAQSLKNVENLLLRSPSARSPAPAEHEATASTPRPVSRHGLVLREVAPTSTSRATGVDLILPDDICRMPLGVDPHRLPIHLILGKLAASRT